MNIWDKIWNWIYVSDTPVRLYREVVLLTEDRNLRLKAHTHNVPVKDIPAFMKWSSATWMSSLEKNKMATFYPASLVSWYSNRVISPFVCVLSSEGDQIDTVLLMIWGDLRNFLSLTIYRLLRKMKSLQIMTELCARKWRNYFGVMQCSVT